jgi:hypothetical protein
MSSTTNTSNDLLQPLRDAVATGQASAIREALPEPPQFLSAVFGLPPDDRDLLLAAVLSALDTDEDCWEIIEAAAMDAIAHPERRAFSAVAPYVPAELVDDARKLLARFPDRDEAQTLATLLSMPRQGPVLPSPRQPGLRVRSE